MEELKKLVEGLIGYHVDTLERHRADYIDYALYTDEDIIAELEQILEAIDEY